MPLLTLAEFVKTSIGVFLLSAIIADVLPSPADWVHFAIQNHIYRKRMKRWKFEVLQAIDWYLIDTLWWVILFFVAFYLEINNYSTLQTITTIATILGV